MPLGLAPLPSRLTGSRDLHFSFCQAGSGEQQGWLMVCWPRHARFHTHCHGSLVPPDGHSCVPRS